MICLGDRFGATCAPEVMSDFAQAIKKHLGIEPNINDPYSGAPSHVANEYGEKREDKSKRDFIQIELGRYLYVDEKTQRVDREKAKRIKDGLSKAMQEIAQKYSK